MIDDNNLMEDVDENYYYEHDILIGTHIAAHATLKMKGNGEEDKIGVVLCNNQIAFHSGMDSMNVLDLTLFDERLVCSKCMKEYKEDKD